MKEEVLNLIYPRRCPICESVLAPKDKYIHKCCRSKLVFIKQPSCMRCGKPVETSEIEYCFDCSNKAYHYSRGFPCIKYDKCMSKSIAAFKYKGKREYADFYIDEILREYGDKFRRLHFDRVVPIPIHKSKYKERGFNQAELLANGIGKGIGVPVDSKILTRHKKTLPQKELNEKERLKNLEQAFEIGELNTITKCCKVLLVDDIYTTGSTIEACAKLLLRAGVGTVYYTSICIGQGY